MKRSLSAQFSIGFALIIIVTVALISMVSNVLITREFESYMEKQQEEYSQELADGISLQYGAGSWNIDYIHGMGMYALNDGYIIKVVDADGETVWDAENHDMEQCHQIMMDIEERMQALNGKNGQFVTHEYALESSGNLVGYAQIKYYTPYYYNENAFGFVDALNLILLFMGLIAVVGAICVAFLFSRSIAKPIVQVTKIADEIAQGNYSVRAENDTGVRELKELSGSINRMAEKIDRQENIRRQLTSDVAHELRTPIANISAQLEVILEGVFEPSEERLQGIYDEISRLSLLVSDLEKLQQIEGTSLDKSRFDLLETAENIASIFDAETAKKSIVCTVSGEHTVISADKPKIQQVLTNLISNAIKYSYEGGAVEIAVKDGGGCAVVSVKDNGIGIPEKDKELIFERFYRTDKSRNRKTGGAGIGLTIVAAIVNAHGGKIQVESEEGNGSVFTVTLPK